MIRPSSPAARPGRLGLLGRLGPLGPLGRLGAAWLACAVLLLGALPATADEYDPQEAAHPLRLVAYVLHPVGVVLDLLLVRPAHWLVSLPGVAELTGHEPYED